MLNMQHTQCYDCKKEKEELLLSKGSCSTTCAKGWIKSKGKCYKCPEGCSNCTASDGPYSVRCSSCEKGLIKNVIPGTESKPNYWCSEKCEDKGTFFNKTSNECRRCGANCESCVAKGSTMTC